MALAATSRRALALAIEMRRWGLVGIATNYTHAAGVPIGAPGTANDPGASDVNVLRGHGARDSSALNYEIRPLAAHGHSMGAFVTTALVAAYPADFRVASHTAGGIVAGDHRRSGPERGAGTQYPHAISTAPRRSGRGRADCAGPASG